MEESIIIPPSSSLSREMRANIDGSRMLFFAGLPGVGKSLLLQQSALMASEMGRIVHLLQWDVSRLPFETPEILSRFPDTNGVTHAAVRKAVGWWARQGIGQWHHHFPDQAHILIGELPLIGNRLVELVQPLDDEVESLLSGEAARFVVPVPTGPVRQEIEKNREKSFAHPRHEREAGDAPPHILRALWDELYQIAGRLGMVRTPVVDATVYDPIAYQAVYAHLLRYRNHKVLPVDRILATRGSAYELRIEGSELAASLAEALNIMSTIEQRGSLGELERAVENWFQF